MSRDVKECIPIIELNHIALPIDKFQLAEGQDQALMTWCHYVIFYVILSHFGVHKAT